MGSESQRLKIYFHCKLKLSMMQGLKQWLSSAAIPRWLWHLLSFFVFVRSQAAASGGGTRSGVHQRCQCQSLPGHEGGRQIAGLGKQHFPDVSVCVGVSCPRSVCSSLSSCRSCSMWDLSGEMSAAQLLSIIWNRSLRSWIFLPYPGSAKFNRNGL